MVNATCLKVTKHVRYQNLTFAKGCRIFVRKTEIFCQEKQKFVGFVRLSGSFHVDWMNLFGPTSFIHMPSG